MPEEAPAETATKAALDDCIHKLQARSQDALKLRYEQDLAPNEIASKLGMTTTAVTSMMHRVHKALAKCIKQALATD